MNSNDNLYDMIFPDSDDDSDDIGRIRINEIFSNQNIDDISKYFNVSSYNNSFPDNNDSSLNVIHFNIRNLLSNKDELEAIISTMKRKPDVICLSETWLDNSDDSTIKIEGFLIYNVIRESPHGGVSILVSDNLKSNLVPNFSYVSAELEICTVTITLADTEYTVSSLYRPHFKHARIKEFKNALEPILNNKLFKKSKTILVGDFNINLLEHHTHPDTNLFLSFMQNHFYLPVITRATRFPEGLQRATPSLLDHIYINFSPPAVSGILKVHITDHLPVFFTFILPKSKIQSHTIKFRIFKEDSRKKFTRDLALVLWEEVLTSNDLNCNFDAFLKKFSQLYNTHFPVVTKTLSHKRLSHPWVTPFLVNALNNKSISYTNFKSGLISWDEYKRVRNQTNAILKATKRSYYINLFNNFKSNTKKLWETLNKLTKSNHSERPRANLISNNSIISNPREIANTFNTFFAGIATQLESRLPPAETDPMHYLRGNFPNSMVVPDISICNVVKVIKTLKSKKCGIDDFASFIIKENAHLLAQPLSFLFNQSIESGKFPNALKSAKIIPLHKKGPRSDVNNYRPISLLNIFSKIFEKIMKEYLVSFMENNNILNKGQFGFQSGKGTLEALIKFSSEVYSQLDQSNYLLSILVDFSKAFDTVPHALLLKKLEFYGIRGIINNWFADYLRNRSHTTIVDGETSSSAKVLLGVPQGSVLGPILFLIFVNDLPNISELMDSILFADDANLYLQGPDPNTLIVTANNELYNLYKWCIANRISINTIKTVFLLFGNSSPADLSPLVIKSGTTYEVIKRVDNTKFLGVFYDCKMSFKHHINYLVQRLSRTSALIYQLKDFMPTFVLKTIYHAHIGSILSYCNIIWSGAYVTNLMPLTLILKRIIRNITCSEFLAHTKPLFRETKILDLPNLRLYSLALYFLKHKIYNDYNLNRHHTYETRHRHNLHLPAHRSRLYRQSFLCESIVFWNEIMNSPMIEIDTANNLFTFKRRIKAYLLSKD